MGSLRVGHDWATSLSLFIVMHWRGKWQPTPVFLPGESQGRWSLVGCRLWGHTVRHDWSDLAEAAAAAHIYSCFPPVKPYPCEKHIYQHSVYASVFLYYYHSLTLHFLLFLSLVSALVRLHHTFVIQIASSATLYTPSRTSPISLLIYFQRSIH